jgi:hypothetical protein
MHVSRCHPRLFQEQSRAFDEFRNRDHRLIGWLKPNVNCLYTISTNSAFRAGVSHVSSPFPRLLFYYSRTSSFTLGISPCEYSSVWNWLPPFCTCPSHTFQLPSNDNVWQAAKYVRSSYNSLVDIFECIENFTRRLKIYTDIRPTPAMTETIIKIMAELFSVVTLTTGEMYQGKWSESPPITITVIITTT